MSGEQPSSLGRAAEECGTANYRQHAETLSLQSSLRGQAVDSARGITLWLLRNDLLSILCSTQKQVHSFIFNLILQIKGSKQKETPSYES